MRIRLPEHVQQIIQRLEKEGYEAYAVGGCIRDTLLGRLPQDWDITTSACPQAVKELFSHTVDTGIRHGTVTVLLNRQGYEVTTYRIDGEYEDGRHPKSVTFTGELAEDLKRRDFTINAMAYNETRGLVDEFDGTGDLKRGIIRCVGSPVERFEEDALRMLRAVRFAAQLGFDIEEETGAAVAALSGTIAKVSAERIQMELVKLLLSPHPDMLGLAYEFGLTKVFLPEFDRMMETDQRSIHHCYTVGEHTLRTLREVPADKQLRLAMLLHDVAKPCCKTTDENGQNHFKGHPQEGEKLAGEILRRLKFDNDTREQVCCLIRFHDDRPKLSPRNVRRAISRIGAENMPALFAVKRADTLGQSMYQREEKLQYIKDYEELFHEIQREGQCVSKKTLALGGRDLIAMGMKSGEELGRMLDTLFEHVLEDPSLNTKERLSELAHKLDSRLI